MEAQRRARYALGFMLLGALLAALLVWNVNTGSLRLPIG